MKTLEEITKSYKSECLDGRDLTRLASFIPFNMLSSIGLEVKEEVTEEDWNSKVEEFTKENVLGHLENDVEFGFEKALNKRGISSSFMADVVKMWNWVLEEGLEDFDEYTQYGLPLFKVTAVKYGFDNPIGDDKGNEYKYSAEFDYEEDN